MCELVKAPYKCHNTWFSSQVFFKETPVCPKRHHLLGKLWYYTITMDVFDRYSGDKVFLTEQAKSGPIKTSILNAAWFFRKLQDWSNSNSKIKCHKLHSSYLDVTDFLGSLNCYRLLLISKVLEILILVSFSVSILIVCIKGVDFQRSLP